MTIYDKFFALAKEKGIEAAELSIDKSKSLSISLYHKEVEGFKADSSTNVLARGIYHGKFGTYACNVINASNIEKIVDGIISNASLVEKDEPALLFKGSEKYHKVSTYNKSMNEVTVDEKKAKLFELEQAVYDLDKRIVDVSDVTYEESETESMLMNTYGLKLRQKSNLFVYYAVGIARVGDETKTNMEFFIGNDWSKLDIKELAKKIVEGATSKLGGAPCETAKMKTVLSQGCVSTLLGAYLSSTVAEEVQKKSSLFVGKLNQKVASSKLTVSEKPLAKTLYARWFDDEGVATYNKDIIKNGVLKTYLYNLETAHKEGIESTGNGYRGGGKISTSTSAIFVKPGKKSLDELFASVGNGIYITDLQGAHAGLNAQSGNFSLQCEGFMIRDGKKAEPVSLITVSGNLVELFNSVEAVGSDVKALLSGTITPSLVIRRLSIGGK